MIITDLFAVVASVAVVDYLSEILIMIIKKEKVYFSILLVLYQKKIGRKTFASSLLLKGSKWKDGSLTVFHGTF